MQHKIDFLIVGSGIAGLSYALKVAQHGTTYIISKTEIKETSTSYAQGGIAAVTNKFDSFDKHINDTMICGSNLSKRNIVEAIVKEGPSRIKELIGWGTNFDKEKEGQYDLAKEGGHSEHRILHHKDNTGFELQRALTKKVLEHPNIKVFHHHFAIDLITQHHLGKNVRQNSTDVESYGVYVLDIEKNIVETILAKKILIATGGTGNLYHTTTNPKIATGDGIAMVYRAKGTIGNMEFIQFHPTSLYNPDERPSFLITEAMRGFGGILRTIDGKEFMHKYDDRKSLAPRDIVARAIDNELKIRGDDFVYLDCTFLEKNELKNKFPNIYKKCLSIGFDFTEKMIPVIPAAHYLCGGIKVNEWGQSTIKNLYSAGEVAFTGMHGANRLASNSLLEAVVIADRAAKKSIAELNSFSYPENIPDWDTEGTKNTEEMILITQNKKEMQQIMSNYVGIVRSNLRLQRALDRLEIIYRETEDLYKKSDLSIDLCELRNLINVGYLTIKMAKKRKESIGLHCSIDYPKK